MQKMMIAGAMLLALGGAASAAPTPATATAALTAMVPTTTAPTAKAALSVVSGAKALSTGQKADVNGGQREGCMTTTTIYYFLGYEYSRTIVEVCYR